MEECESKSRLAQSYRVMMLVGVSGLPSDITALKITLTMRLEKVYLDSNSVYGSVNSYCAIIFEHLRLFMATL